MASDYAFYIIAAIGFGILGLAILFEESDAVQVTPAFSEIIINGTSYKAKTYNEKLYLSGDFIMQGKSIGVSGGSLSDSFKTVIIDGVSITATQPEDTLTITTPGHITTTVDGNTVTIKLTQFSCPLLQGVKGVDSNGNFVCAAI